MRIFILSLFVVALFCSHSAFAVKSRGSASISIVDPVEIEELSGYAPFELVLSDSFIGGILKGIPAKNNYKQNIPQSEYSITGSTDDSIQIQIESGDNSEGINIKDFVVMYKNKKLLPKFINYGAPGKKANLSLDAVLSVDSSAKAGFYYPSFEISIYYE